MKKNELDIVFLLDKSGSMSGSEKDTIGGYNNNKYLDLFGRLKGDKYGYFKEIG